MLGKVVRVHAEKGWGFNPSPLCDSARAAMMIYCLGGLHSRCF